MNFKSIFTHSPITMENGGIKILKRIRELLEENKEKVSILYTCIIAKAHYGRQSPEAHWYMGLIQNLYFTDLDVIDQLAPYMRESFRIGGKAPFNIRDYDNRKLMLDLLIKKYEKPE